MAVEFCISKSLVWAYSTWRSRHMRAVEVARFSKQVEEMGRVAVVRKALTTWKYCILSTVTVPLGNLLCYNSVSTVEEYPYHGKLSLALAQIPHLRRTLVIINIVTT